MDDAELGSDMPRPLPSIPADRSPSLIQRRNRSKLMKAMASNCLKTTSKEVIVIDDDAADSGVLVAAPSVCAASSLAPLPLITMNGTGVRVATPVVAASSIPTSGMPAVDSPVHSALSYLSDERIDACDVDDSDNRRNCKKQRSDV